MIEPERRWLVPKGRKLEVGDRVYRGRCGRAIVARLYIVGHEFMMNARRRNRTRVRNNGAAVREINSLARLRDGYNGYLIRACYDLRGHQCGGSSVIARAPPTYGVTTEWCTCMKWYKKVNSWLRCNQYISATQRMIVNIQKHSRWVENVYECTNYDGRSRGGFLILMVHSSNKRAGRRRERERKDVRYITLSRAKRSRQAAAESR